MVPLIRWLRRVADSSGSELVEAALTFPLLLLVVMGIIDFGLAFQQYEVLTNAAREGARIAVLPSYSTADAEFRVHQYLDAAFLAQDAGAAATITVGDPVDVILGGKCMQTRTVTVTYPHEFLFVGGIVNFFNPGSTLGTTNLTASSTMRSEVAGVACTP